MYDELSQVTLDEIKIYLYDIYPVKLLKIIKNNNKEIIIKSSSNEMIHLDYQQFKLYCGFYDYVIRLYKYEFKKNKTITIPIYFSQNTAICIENLINYEDHNAYKKATNLYEYITVYDYLNVSFNK
jgi:hypothetical protein